MNELNPNRI